MKVGRNDPCPCGSGKKYKKCCMEKDMKESVEITREDAYRLERVVLEKAFHFIKTPKYHQDLDESRNLFFDVHPDEELDITSIKPMDSNNYMLWFMCDYSLKEERTNPLHLFMDREVKNLTENQRKMAHILAHSHLVLYDPVRSDEETGSLTLRNLFVFQGVEIQDEMLSSMAGKNVFFGLRIVEFEGVKFSAGDIYVYPEELKENVLLSLKNQLVDPKAIVPPSAEDLLKKKGYIFNHIQMMLDHTHPVKEKERTETEEKPPEKEKTEEPEVSLARAHFMVDDYEKVKQILNDLDIIKLEKERDGKVIYTMSKTPARALAGEKDGIIHLGRRKLIFETKNNNCFEEYRNNLGKKLKPYVKYMYDDVEKRRDFARN